MALELCSLPPAEAITVKIRLGDALTNAGMSAEAAQVYLDATAEAPRPGSTCQRRASAPCPRWRSIAHSFAARAYFKERSAEEIDARQLVVADPCWSAALALSLVDTVRSADFQARHLFRASRG